MSVRRPLWVQRLAFVIFELTDPAGAARLRMSRGALNEAGLDPVPQPGRGAPASLSASADVVSLPGASSPLLGARPRTSVPGLGRTRSLFWFGFVVLGLPLGVAAATLAGAVT